MLTVYQKIRRFTTLNNKTFEKLFKLLRTMTTYSIDEPQRERLTEYFYDDDTHALEKNGLLLRKRVGGKTAKLAMMRKVPDEKFLYLDSLREKDRQCDIKPSDPLSNYYTFLNTALNSMFASDVQFDTDKLFEKMKVNIVLRYEREDRTMFGYGGLKFVMRYDKIAMDNLITKRKNKTEIVEFLLLSKEETLPLFDDFITRVTKHCKEIFYTKDTVHEIVSRMTKPMPTKQELEKLKRELKKKQDEEKAQPKQKK